MRESYPDINLVIQESNMSEEAKEEFLSLFSEKNEETHVGFCVLGGHFSEGIDLTNDKLIGVPSKDLIILLLKNFTTSRISL